MSKAAKSEKDNVQRRFHRFRSRPSEAAEIRGPRMLYDDYLRDEAARYRKLAEQTKDEAIKKELLELAAVCEEAANEAEDRLTAG
jgi:hypothetical protein